MDARGPIFIGGEGRSGTTLMRVILDSHPHLACGPETHFFIEENLEGFISSLTERHRHWILEYDPFPERLMPICFGEVLNTFHSKYAVSKGKRRWADKTPYNIKKIDFLYRAFPNMQFIHVIRDGRDVVASLLEMSWASNDVGVLAQSWVDCIKKGKNYRGNVKSYMEVRYEDLVTKPISVLNLVFKYLNEPWSNSVLKFHKRKHDLGNESSTQQVQKTLYNSSIGRWKKDLTPEQLNVFYSIAKETLLELGYEC